MKLLAYILSIYFLVLTAIPCVDVPEDHDICKVEQAQDATDHQHETDDCSPFCTCQCCTTPVVFHEFIVHFKCFSYTQKQFPACLLYTSDAADEEDSVDLG